MANMPDHIKVELTAGGKLVELLGNMTSAISALDAHVSLLADRVAELEEQQTNPRPMVQ